MNKLEMLSRENGFVENTMANTQIMVIIADSRLRRPSKT